LSQAILFFLLGSRWIQPCAPNKIRSPQWHVSFYIETACWRIPPGTTHIVHGHSIRAPGLPLGTCLPVRCQRWLAALVLRGFWTLVIFHLLADFSGHSHWQVARRTSGFPGICSSFRFAWHWLKKWLNVLSGACQRVMSALSSCQPASPGVKAWLF
jgi:hypothetical protein